MSIFYEVERSGNSGAQVIQGAGAFEPARGPAPGKVCGYLLPLQPPLPPLTVGQHLEVTLTPEAFRQVFVEQNADDGDFRFVRQTIVLTSIRHPQYVCQFTASGPPQFYQ